MDRLVTKDTRQNYAVFVMTLRQPANPHASWQAYYELDLFVEQ